MAIGTKQTEQPRPLVVYGAALMQGLFGLVGMTSLPEGGQFLGPAFFLIAGAMMIVGALGIAWRERWGWAIAGVFDVLYVLAAFGGLGWLTG